MSRSQSIATHHISQGSDKASSLVHDHLDGPVLVDGEGRLPEHPGDGCIGPLGADGALLQGDHLRILKSGRQQGVGLDARTGGLDACTVGLDACTKEEKREFSSGYDASVRVGRVLTS